MQCKMLSRGIQRTFFQHYSVPKYRHTYLQMKQRLHRKSEHIGRLRMDEEFLETGSRNSAEIIASDLLELDEELRYTTFRSWIDSRREEARKSLFVQVKSLKSASDLAIYCNQNFGIVKGLHYHHNVNSEAFSHFFVVEFEDVESVGKAMFDGAEHNNSNRGNTIGSVSIPVSSPFMWFSSNNATHNPTSEQITVQQVMKDEMETPILMPFRNDQLLALKSSKNLNQYLLQFETLDDQIREFYDLCKMTDIGTRIRFLACEQIELALTGMFPHAEILPFGSSVNSFGKFDCDLDMSVRLVKQHFHSDNTSSRLLFHTKGSRQGQGSRIQSQRYCDQISNIIQNFLPGCQNVHNILHARVPIIKYCQELVGLECDLCASTSGYYMSELLYMYGELDNRVRPLVFTIRRWAKEQGLVRNDRPTPFFTNFTLTLMAIFFLQNHYKMLPPFNELRKLADPIKDKHICEDGVDCSFIRDISGLQAKLNNHWKWQTNTRDKSREAFKPLSLSSMLMDFFKFYAEFDYQRGSVCVVTGQVQPKRGSSKSTKVAHKVSLFLDVVNPLEPDLNVSANIQEHALNMFRKQCEEFQKKMEKLQNLDMCEKLESSSCSKLSYIFGDDNYKNELVVPISSGFPDVANNSRTTNNGTKINEDSFSQTAMPIKKHKLLAQPIKELLELGTQDSDSDYFRQEPIPISKQKYSHDWTKFRKNTKSKKLLTKELGLKDFFRTER